MTTLGFAILESDEELDVSPAHLIVAGYTGRDSESVRAHIDELAAIGVPPPPQVPMFYELEPSLLTLGDVAVNGHATGEVEPALIRAAGRWYLGLGSDITDRELEREDILRAKAVCPKPLGSALLPLPEDVNKGGYDATWDRIEVSSKVDGATYQAGRLEALRPPGDLLTRLASALPHTQADVDLVVMAGTLPLLSGGFRAGRTWEAHLTLPNGHTLDHKHTCTPTGRD